MHDYNLGFISNENIYQHVKKTVEGYRRENGLITINAIMIRDFHKNILHYAPNGWIIPEKGFDVENQERHIFVEMKDRHITMNSLSSQYTYIKMQQKLLEDDEAICYLVEYLSTKSRDEIWEFSLDNTLYSHERIRRMSLDRFYTLVFKDNEAYSKLHNKLPEIISDVIREENHVAF